ncbi:MAG: alpha-glucosidase C-terminal domain-containing protein [Alistipes sp.]|nr:alpha-glucosidase C-terminal domain-containing protein [Alistipes sp.]
MKKFFAIIAAALAFVSCCNCGSDAVATTNDFDKYNSVVYELNIRQATVEGTFAAAEKYLPELKAMGVDIVWLMPISPIGVDGRKGTLGSYYSIIDYKAINPEFGTMEDFDHFLATAHDLGLKVILDWVANHTSRDANWWREGKKDWYVIDETTGLPIVEYDWTDIAKLNYKNQEMRAAMLDALKFWVEKGVDGYRCDVAMNVPGDFWKMAWEEIRAINPDVYLLAEGEETWLHESGFDATYAWELHHIFNAMAKGGSETKNVAGDGTIKTDAKSVADLKEYLARDDEKYPAPAMRLMFTSNHDENSWAGTEFERMGDAYRTFAALTFVLPKSQPLIYTGQEIGLNRRLAFFEKDSVEELVDVNYGQDFRDFYRRLTSFRHNNSVLAAGANVAPMVYLEGAPETVLAFSRENDNNKVFCVFNFSNEPQVVTVTEEFAGDYTRACGQERSLQAGDVIELGAWGFELLAK